MYPIRFPQLNLPPWFIGGLAAVWVAVVLWQVVEAALFRSAHRKRVDQVMADTTEGLPSGLEAQMLEAGWNLGPNAEAKLYGIMLLLFVGVVFAGSALDLPPLLVVLGAGVAAYAPRWVLTNRQRGRGEALDRELPDALTRVANLLRIQPNVANVLGMTADSLSSTGETTLSKELRRTAADMRSQGADALQALERRAASPSLANLAFALRIYVRAGGEFSAVMATMARRTRRILEGRNRAVAKAGEATIAAKVLPALLVLVTAFVAQDPDFAGFYRSVTGQIIVGGVIVLMAFGYFVIQGMIRDVT